MAQRTVKCPACGWSKTTSSPAAAVLAGHAGQCPKRQARPRRDRVKWKDWRTSETPFTPLSADEVQALRLRQRGVGGGQQNPRP